MSILEAIAKAAKGAGRALDTPVEHVFAAAMRSPTMRRTGNAAAFGGINGLMGGMMGTMYADDPRLSDEEKLQMLLRAALISGAGGALSGGLLGERAMLPAGMSMFASGPIAHQSMGDMSDRPPIYTSAHYGVDEANQERRRLHMPMLAPR